MTLTIVGAGMAGLIAARVLRDREPVVVIESSPSLPHNHTALLRFRTSVIGDVCRIPFRKVRVIKSTVPWRNPAADALAYARKVSEEYRSDRSIIDGQEIVERYIAPPDFIERLAKGVDIRYGKAFDFPPDHPKVISTIPMVHLMTALGYDSSSVFFRYRDGVNVLATVRGADAHASVYVPDPDLPFARVSITGDHLIAELHGKEFFPLVEDRGNHSFVEETIWAAGEALGIKRQDIEPSSIRAIHQTYSKIVPIDEGERRRFIHWASTIQGRAFSLGRFATWRPGLMNDDLIKDLRVIEGLMDSTSFEYDAEKLERDSLAR